VRRTTGQPHISFIAQALRFSLFAHFARMSDETDAMKILTASPFEELEEDYPARPEIQ